MLGWRVAIFVTKRERRFTAVEATHRMTTKDFVRRFENDELDETLELAEWIGEYRLLQRLSDKTETLRGVRFAS